MKTCNPDINQTELIAEFTDLHRSRGTMVSCTERIDK